MWHRIHTIREIDGQQFLRPPLDPTQPFLSIYSTCLVLTPTPIDELLREPCQSG